jgi:hypothetical protein
MPIYFEKPKEVILNSCKHGEHLRKIHTQFIFDCTVLCVKFAIRLSSLQ